MNRIGNRFHVMAIRALLALAVFVSLFLAVTPGLAKRAVPKSVAPVAVAGVEYSAPVEQMGYVIATDIHSHKELWRERIYSVHFNPLLERDVQDVFITSLVVDHKTLLITNERGERFTLDLSTRKVAWHDEEKPVKSDRK